MKMSTISSWFLLSFLIVSSLQGQKKPAVTSDKSITASGYVTAGVEAGCLMLQDSKTKTLYNLLFADKKQPALGSEIQFTGTRHDGPTTCMQGEAIDVKKWTPLKTKPMQHSDRIR